MGLIMLFDIVARVLIIAEIIFLVFALITLAISIILFIFGKKRPKGKRKRFFIPAAIFALPSLLAVTLTAVGYIENAVTQHERRLFNAVYDLDVEKVEKYLKRGDDPNKFDEPVNSYPLRYVFYNVYGFVNVKGKDERLQILELLLENGADPDIPRDLDKSAERDWTQLQLLCSKQSYFDFTYKAAELLLKHGADPNRLDSSERSSLMIVCLNAKEDEYYSIKMAELLLEYGADISQADVYGKTAAHIAEENNCKELAAFLEENS